MTPVKLKITSSFLLGGVGLWLLLSGSMPALNLLLLSLFTLGLYAITEMNIRHKTVAIALWLVTLLLGFFIAIYRPGDFHYPLIWHFSELHEGGKDFALYANTSKALGGYLVIIWFLMRLPRDETRPSLGLSVVAILTATIFLLLIANLLFGVRWQPKLPEGWLYFVVVNLGITVIAEEAFFRLLVQRQLVLLFSNKKPGVWIAAASATGLFALAHTTTPGPALLLFLVAGAVYSAVYAYTNRLSMAVAVHFGVNILHFLLLEYPLPF